MLTHLTLLWISCIFVSSAPQGQGSRMDKKEAHHKRRIASINFNSVMMQQNPKVYNCTEEQGFGYCVRGVCCGAECCSGGQDYCSDSGSNGTCLSSSPSSKTPSTSSSSCGSRYDGYYYTDANGCGKNWYIPLILLCSWVVVFLIVKARIPEPTEETSMIEDTDARMFTFANFVLSVFLTPLLWSFFVFRIKDPFYKVAFIRSVGLAFYAWGILYSIIADYTFAVFLSCAAVGFAQFAWANRVIALHIQENRVFSIDSELAHQMAEGIHMEETPAPPPEEELPTYDFATSPLNGAAFSPMAAQTPAPTPSINLPQTGNISNTALPPLQAPPPYYIAQMDDPSIITYDTLENIAELLHMPELLSITIQGSNSFPFNSQQLSLMTFDQLAPFGVTRESYLKLKRYFLAHRLEAIQTGNS